MQVGGHRQQTADEVQSVWRIRWVGRVWHSEVGSVDIGQVNSAEVGV